VVGARALDVTVNDQPLGRIDRLIGDGAIARHSIQGLWYERDLAFDASLMKKGTNVLKLIVPAGPVNNGIIYDYLRLELDEGDKVIHGGEDSFASRTSGLSEGGEAAETQVWIEFAVKSGYMEREHAEPLYRAYDDVLRTLVGMITHPETWLIGGEEQ
jgi:hypothetical protein